MCVPPPHVWRPRLREKDGQPCKSCTRTYVNNTNPSRVRKLSMLSLMRMAQEGPRRGPSPALAAVRCAAARGLWVEVSPPHAGLRTAVDHRRREARAPLQVARQEEQSRIVALAAGEPCRGLGW